jgi:hypothetical protein
MARRKPARKRTRRFTGLNVTNTALAAYQANAVLNAATGSNLVSFFMPGAKSDNALNLTEIIQGLTGTGIFTPGTGAGKGWVVPGGGKPAVPDLGVAGAMLTHLKSNAIPAAIKIVGSNAAVKVARKMGVFRNMNKLVRTAGLQSVVRF